MTHTPPVTQVFVVMGNDFPACVFSTEQLADDYCELRRNLERKSFHPTYQGETYHTRIHWRVYEFSLLTTLEDPST